MHWQLRPNQSLSELFITWKENLIFRVSIRWFPLSRHNTFTPFCSNYKSKKLIRDVQDEISTQTDNHNLSKNVATDKNCIMINMDLKFKPPNLTFMQNSHIFLL